MPSHLSFRLEFRIRHVPRLSVSESAGVRYCLEQHSSVDWQRRPRARCIRVHLSWLTMMGFRWSQTFDLPFLGCGEVNLRTNPASAGQGGRRRHVSHAKDRG